MMSIQCGSAAGRTICSFSDVLKDDFVSAKLHFGTVAESTTLIPWSARRSVPWRRLQQRSLEAIATHDSLLFVTLLGSTIYRDKHHGSLTEMVR